MAILAGGLLVVGDEEPIITPPSVAYSEDVGTMSATWVDPDGVEWPLTNIGPNVGWFTTSTGPASWGATPIELVTDALARGGEQVRYIRQQPRRIQWPIYVYGEDHLQYTERRRRIVRAFTKTTQRQSHGWLRVYRPDGRYRQIAAYYEEGFEGEAGQDHLFSESVITLFCPDGRWVADRTVLAERSFVADVNPTNPNVPANFYSPFMFLGSSRVVSEDNAQVGNTTIVNDGDVEAWPEWRITGPMTKAECVNNTLGTRFAITHTLTAGQQITITTNRPTVRGPGDVSLANKIDWFNPGGGAYLWPLDPGENDVRFEVDGASDGTKIEMTFTPRYESA